MPEKPQDKEKTPDKNSRFRRYEERQKAQKDKEKSETRKVIGWSVERNEKIYED